MSDDLDILKSAHPSGGLVSSQLLPLVYDELRSLAARQMARERAHQTLQPTALVHEAWLKLGHEDLAWNDREHFFRAAAQAMRRILVDRVREKSALKRGEGIPLLDLDQLDIAATGEDERILQIDEALTILEKDDPDVARVVSLKFFGGLTNKEIAKMDGVSERTIERHWAYAKARLLLFIRDAH
ncbi:RNA polymerase sigma factor (TIGR02999 family) [Haloferula luteola]|uniref:RNA polymerase sigma factor (TIGR02999 family) n=1 Tax=Haloferula luteola TaxID=595692 RepID=A0A840UV38_9BACT|nr:ECF-type sigma factor [Haloferula luteola]MBB5350057.1 RNA polymerase sigma factor (TIGR02999 family) [Haloferula luteola]